MNGSDYGVSYGYVILIALCFALAMTANFVYAADTKSPHEGMEDVTGVITGRLLKDGRTPVAGHQVTLEILQGHNVILTVSKATDQKGGYQFKNIFRSPDFAYAVSTEHEGRMYRTEFVSLDEKEVLKNVDLKVGAGAEPAVPLPPPIDDEETGGAAAGGHTHAHKRGLNEYQFLAIILALAAVGYALYRRRTAK